MMAPIMHKRQPLAADAFQSPIHNQEQGLEAETRACDNEASLTKMG